MKRRDALRATGGLLAVGSGYYGLSGTGSGGRNEASPEEGRAERSTPRPTPSDAGTETTAPVDRDWSEREGTVLLGVKPRSLDVDALERFERWQGRRCATVVVYANMGLSSGGIDWLFDLCTDVWETGHVPHLIWQPYIPTKEETSDTVTADIAAGAHDETLRLWSRRLGGWLRGADSGPNRRLYLNFAPEMNGDWIPWTSTGETTPEDFVAMWRHVYDTVLGDEFDETDAQWVWTVNHTTHSPDPIPAYYPGDDYVDWVGVHGYNAWGEWNSPSDVYGPVLRTLRDLTEKPVALSEFGSASRVDGTFSPDQKAEWIRRAFEYIEERGIRMACWFNEDKEYDWAVFGSAHGTDTYRHGGKTYQTYDAYRTATERASVLPAYPNHPRVVTDREFAGVSEATEETTSERD